MWVDTYQGEKQLTERITGSSSRLRAKWRIYRCPLWGICTTAFVCNLHEIQHFVVVTSGIYGDEFGHKHPC